MKRGVNRFCPSVPGRRSSKVEQLIRNQQVVGSIPIVGSLNNLTIIKCFHASASSQQDTILELQGPMCVPSRTSLSRE